MDSTPYTACAFFTGGQLCGDDAPCAGGFCDDAGACEIDQVLGFVTECFPPQFSSDACATGPCCLDAGDGFGGWCCGLVDGGVTPACFGQGAVCLESSNCCAALTCIGQDAALYTYVDIDAGLGFCEPQ
jgi:hypothetical protein